MAKKKADPAADFLDAPDDTLDDLSTTSQLAGTEEPEPEIPVDLTVGQAIRNFIVAKEESAQANKIQKQKQKALAYATRAVYQTMQSQDPPQNAVEIDGYRISRYETTVGTLIGGKDAAIEGIRADGLDDRLITIGVAEKELNKFVNELIEQGAPFPSWVKPFGVEKISMTKK